MASAQVQEKPKPAEPMQARVQEAQPDSIPEFEMCPTHKRKLEIICIDDKVRICSNCALFGNHKNHEFRMENEVM